MELNIPEWIEDLLIQVGGISIGVLFIAIITFYGSTNLPGSKIFDSEGGILIGTIILMELFFFSAIVYFSLSENWMEK